MATGVLLHMQREKVETTMMLRPENREERVRELRVRGDGRVAF